MNKAGGPSGRVGKRVLLQGAELTGMLVMAGSSVALHTLILAIAPGIIIKRHGHYNPEQLVGPSL